MNKKVLIPTILFAVVLIFSFAVLSKNKTDNQPANQITNGKSQETWQNQIILFYGDGCPHCAIVEEYIKDNKVKEKIYFVEKEVYYNRGNADELAEKAKKCGLSADSIGVPFLWNGSNCVIGDQSIIEFFEQKINEK